MILTHWSEAPVGDIHSVQPGYWRGEEELGPFTKPNGFWLSDDADFGWKEWCEREGFNLSRFTHRTDFSLDLSGVLWLKTEADLISLIKEYGVVTRFGDKTPDWKVVGRDYCGILITPYQAELHLDLLWYNPWDCASACIWDVSCLTALEALIEQESE